MKTIHLTILIFAFMNVTAGPAHGQVQIAARTIIEKSAAGKSAGDAADQTMPATYYDDLIRQNPEAASLYIQKATTQIKNGAGPQVIINTLEEALKQGGLIGTNREVAMVYHYLGYAYLQMDNIYSAVVNYNRAHALAPGSRLQVDHIVSGDPHPAGNFR